MCDGGLGGCYSTLLNTIGVGDPVPPGFGNQLGSGDLFGSGKVKPAVKKGANQKNSKPVKQTKQPNYGEMLPLMVKI